MQFIETASFGSRVAGKLTKRPSLGVTLQYSFSTISRLFLLPLLLSLSFMIESGLSIQLFLLTSFFLTISAFFTSLAVLIKFNYFQLLFQAIFREYQFSTVPVSIVKVIFGKKIEFDQIDLKDIPRIRTLSVKKIFFSSLAYSFLSAGFLVSFSLAILVPEYRMTMSQFTTAFQGVGIIILTMYIDPMISKSLDIELENIYWVKNIYSILIGRVLAYLFTSISFIVFYLYMY
jgi:hypothetical protein